MLAVVLRAAHHLEDEVRHLLVARTDLEPLVRQLAVDAADLADHGDVPAGNKGGPLPRLGRLSPL